MIKSPTILTFAAYFVTTLRRLSLQRQLRLPPPPLGGRTTVNPARNP